jgi:hypothetical protein
VLYTGLVGKPETHRGVPLNATAAATSYFAPTWELVRLAQAVPRDRLHRTHPVWQQYERDYLLLMRKRYRLDPVPFFNVVDDAATGDVTVCCLCHWATAENPVCHRFLLWSLLCKVAEARGLWLDPTADPDGVEEGLLEGTRTRLLRDGTVQPLPGVDDALVHTLWPLRESTPARSKEERNG